MDSWIRPRSSGEGLQFSLFCFPPMEKSCWAFGSCFISIVSPLMSLPWRVRRWPHYLKRQSCFPHSGCFQASFHALLLSGATVSVSGFICLLCYNVSSQSAWTLSLPPLVPRCLEPAWQIVGALWVHCMKVSRWVLWLLKVPYGERQMSWGEAVLQ